MLVKDLEDGMVIRLPCDSDVRAWITDDVAINLPTGERELRLITKTLAGIAPGILLDRNDLIIYLGVTRHTSEDGLRRMNRQIYVRGYTAVIEGKNVQFFEPHPSFNAINEA